ncbi:hypothetical protein JYU29_05575 [Tianweitania sp. BSSL-BM11]|uniref:Uncharacterized protein n=1 Tax=Tianweitania aestuarii TaxID=2814886 RepID=A0ABS5RTL3_9HYPH|nr:hypothetical protein [Tianweitania aestuarii]MBS9720155.1 hypothetical protein [Tianweitania aestuarii]
MRKRLTFPNIIAAIVCVLAVPWMYWAIMDRKPAASSVSEVITPTVMQGDFLQIDYDVIWASTCEIIAFRYIIDEMQVEWPISAQQRIVEAGPSKFTIRIPVPMAAAPGNALYRGTLRFACNPWQRFFPLEQNLRERQFQIVANPELTWRNRRDVFEGPPIMRRFAWMRP